jgi:hypothetical protein
MCIGDPDRKCRVESGIGHTQRTPLRGLPFQTPDAAQTYLDRLNAHWADTHIHGTTKPQASAGSGSGRRAVDRPARAAPGPRDRAAAA